VGIGPPPPSLTFNFFLLFPYPQPPLKQNSLSEETTGPPFPFFLPLSLSTPDSGTASSFALNPPERSLRWSSSLPLRTPGTPMATKFLVVDLSFKPRRE